MRARRGSPRCTSPSLSARAADDRAAARRLVGQLVALYRDRPETAHARAEVEDATRAIIDGRDLIDVAERALLRPLDDKAQGEIAAAAKRVSLVTAISPRAVLDVVFVVAQIVRLVRRIAEIYGGRPGLLGLIKLARSIGAHIAITGGMAVGDSLLQQLVGHGIASRISARMGEGVLNGLLTARVGLSALAVCRPAPFAVDKAARRLRRRAVPVQQGGVTIGGAAYGATYHPGLIRQFRYVGMRKKAAQSVGQNGGKKACVRRKAGAHRGNPRRRWLIGSTRRRNGRPS